LKKAIEEFKPDVVQFHWANPFPAAILLTVIPKNVKLLIHWHMDIIKQKQIYRFIKPIETRFLMRADKIVCTSPQYKDGSQPLQPFKDKVEVVPNAIDESNFIKTNNDDTLIKQIREKYGNKKIIFFVGRHIEYKGLPYLIEAEKHVKSDCVFLIAGSGPLTESIKTSCKSDRVFFVGRLNDEELRCHHYAADVFAFPSITKNEAFGVALAEAMYCYTPAVTFTIEGSGVNWVNLDCTTGIECPNRDAKAFAAAIDKLLSDEQLANKYAQAAHDRVVNNFTIPKMMEQMEAVYSSLQERRK
jgi:glycosyltransferase involved in cell wall biosynthesis